MCYCYLGTGGALQTTAGDVGCGTTSGMPPLHISPGHVTTVQMSQSIGFSLLSRCYPGLSFPWTGVRTPESHLCSAVNSPSEYAPGIL